MTLHVEFDAFADEARRHFKEPVAYVSRIENRTHVSAADPATGMVVSASSGLSLGEAKSQLASQGLDVRHGAWSPGSSGQGDSLGDLPYVAAIAYRSGDEMPGVWVDAFADPPTSAVAIKSLYDEFTRTGEIGEMSLEEFVRLANPNVAIVTPGELERYLCEKGNCE